MHVRIVGPKTYSSNHLHHFSSTVPFVRRKLSVIVIVNALLVASVFYVWRFAYFWIDDFNVFFWIQRLDRSFMQMLADVANPVSSEFRPLGMMFYWLLWHGFDLHPLPYHLFAW